MPVFSQIIECTVGKNTGSTDEHTEAQRRDYVAVTMFTMHLRKRINTSKWRESGFGNALLP